MDTDALDTSPVPGMEPAGLTDADLAAADAKLAALAVEQQAKTDNLMRKLCYSPVRKVATPDVRFPLPGAE